ncbi:MAG: TonB-dependent receptor [Burkholderiaceae bacterium]
MKLYPHARARACALFTLLSAGLPAAALAQEGPIGAPGENPRPGNRLERVEISARPQSDVDLRRKSQVAKQIYGREELDKFGDTNVADVLKRLPGVSVAGGAPRMRGLGAGYTLILINGDPAPPGFALDQLDPAQVERIEVTKGPTADQSAQAVAGAINIILKDAPRVSQRDLRIGVGYNAERPTPSATFTYGERIGGLSMSLPVSAFEWRGVNDSISTRAAPGLDYQPALSTQSLHQDFWGHGFNSAPRLNWKLSDEETLTLQGFAQKGYWNNRNDFSVVGSPSGRPSFDDDGVNHGTWQMLRGNAQWANQFSDTQRIELKAGVQDAKNRSTSQTFPANDGRTKPDRHTDAAAHDRSLTQAGKFSQLLGDAHSLTLGWDLEWRRRDETRTTLEGGVPQLPEFDGQPFSARIERQALFVQDEWEINKQWSTYLGLRGERILTRSEGVGDAVRNVSSVVTPLWHLNYKLDPKGRDLIRASLTRSYKAPDLNALVARPGLSSQFPDASGPNVELYPDRVGNPNLKPELATGLDVAYEKYLAGGGMVSIGGFHRRISDLIRSVTTLETVAWSPVQRYVIRPVNFSKATTTGLELEIKGRAGELMPSLFDPRLALNLRGALSVYRSDVEAVPGSNNRLDSQQPWSANLGFDYRFAGLPLSTGASFIYTPGYLTQQTAVQSLAQSRSRQLDMFAQWVFSRSLSLRLSASNLAPLDTQSTTTVANGYSDTDRSARTQFGAALEFKL